MIGLGVTYDAFQCGALPFGPKEKGGGIGSFVLIASTYLLRETGTTFYYTYKLIRIIVFLDMIFPTIY